MARKAEAQPQIRKSFLVIGGVAVAVALLGFVLMNFVFSGDSGAPPAEQISTEDTTPQTDVPVAEQPAEPAPSGPDGLTPGGRDPFSPAVVVQPQAAPAPPVVDAAVQGVSESNEAATVEVLDVYGDGADLRVDDAVYEGARTGEELDARFAVARIDGDCVTMREQDEAFEACEGSPVTR